MYERFYQLRERPFALSPDPEYLYPSRVHREALDYLRYGLESHAGFVVITGDIGSGKTTLLQTLVRNLDENTAVGRIVNTMLDPRDLIEAILIDFGLDPTGRSTPLLLKDLSQYLVDQRMAGKMVLLVIDEAQNLSLAALEELRMLSNLETEKSKLLQVVMVGQPNLRDTLATPELEQLRQRVTVSYHLTPLDADETANYINHRLRHAAIGTPMEFPREATDAVHARSRGVPRIINVICDAALVFGYAEERRTMDRALIAEVLGELESTGVLPPAKDITEEAQAAEAVAAGGGYRTATSEPPAPRILDARHWPAVAARLTAADESRATDLDRRERALRQRETELAEQRRVLAEEYRLLRPQRAAAENARREQAGARPRPESAAKTSKSPLNADHPGFWSRLRRIMVGAVQPAVEKH